MAKGKTGFRAPKGPRNPIFWAPSTKAALLAMPAEVRTEIGNALDWAQAGKTHPHAKALKGFGGGGVLEVVENHDGDTYRAAYTVKIKGRVIVLHVFQKKSKTGVKTPKADIDLIKKRLAAAEAQYR